MTAWIVVIAAGAVAYAIRLTPVVALARSATPAWLERTLAHAGPASLAALAAPAVAHGPGTPATRVVAVVCAVGVARKGASMALTVAAGMAVLWFAALMEVG